MDGKCFFIHSIFLNQINKQNSTASARVSSMATMYTEHDPQNLFSQTFFHFLIKNGNVSHKNIFFFVDFVNWSQNPQIWSPAKTYQSQGMSLEILHRDLFTNAWHHMSVCLSPHSPPAQVKVEAWKLVCTILTWMAQKLYCPVFWYFA